jgi:hypothetical protein
MTAELKITSSHGASDASTHNDVVASDDAPMRLNEAAIVLWREAGILQLELGARRMVVENVDAAEMAALLARSRSAHPEPITQQHALTELRAVLGAAGFLSPALPEDPLDRLNLVSQPGHLNGDRIALGAQYGPDAAVVMRARRQATVAVHGTGRLAASVAATLAAAGIGWVQLVHGGDVAAADACPGGLTPADEGRRFGIAAADAVRRAAPDVDTTPIPPDRHPDLVVLTDPDPVDPTVAESLHLDGLAHLATHVRGVHAVIGPLVVPGVTSCLRCADLHRTDRDPSWPSFAVQLSGLPSQRVAADVALCVAVAGLAASQALAYLDRQVPATVNGTLEWQLPDWRLRRRSWPPHSGCECAAATGATKHGRMGG